MRKWTKQSVCVGTTNLWTLRLYLNFQNKELGISEDNKDVLFHLIFFEVYIRSRKLTQVQKDKHRHFNHLNLPYSMTSSTKNETLYLSHIILLKDEVSRLWLKSGLFRVLFLFIIKVYSVLNKFCSFILIVFGCINADLHFAL